MGLFTRSKTREQLSAENAQVLKNLTAAVAVLKQMSKTEDVKSRLANIEEELTYSSPTANAEAKKSENRIENKLGDLKILLISKPESPKIKTLLDEVELLIVERNAKC